jgi:hypothetical protein
MGKTKPEGSAPQLEGAPSFSASAMNRIFGGQTGQVVALLDPS